MQVPVGPRPRSVSAQLMFAAVQVPVVESRLRDGPHGAGGILFRIADPAESIPGFLDDDPADLLDQRGLVGGADQGLVGRAERTMRAIHATELLLRALPLGDVLDGADSPHGAPVRVGLDLRPLPHPFHRAANDDAVLDVVRGSAQGGGPRAIDGCPVLGVHPIEEGFVGEGRARGDSEDAKHFIGPGESIAGDVQMPAPEVRDLLRSVQAGLALAQRFLGLLALGDVVHGAAHEHDVAVGVALHFAAARDQTRSPVGRHHLQIQLVRGPRPQGLLHRRVQSGEALRRIETRVLVVAGRRLLRIAADDTVQLFGPGDLVDPWIPPPATHSGEALRLSELLLPPEQNILPPFGVRHRRDRSGIRPRR